MQLNIQVKFRFLEAVIILEINVAYSLTIVIHMQIVVDEVIINRISLKHKQISRQGFLFRGGTRANEKREKQKTWITAQLALHQ